MARTGTKQSTSTKFLTDDEHRSDVALEQIIEDFGTAMRDANKSYVSRPVECSHDTGINFTIRMGHVWQQYIEWCRNG